MKPPEKPECFYCHHKSLVVSDKQLKNGRLGEAKIISYKCTHCGQTVHAVMNVKEMLEKIEQYEDTMSEL